MNRIYYNGPVLTMEAVDGRAAVEYAPEAVYVRDGKIAAVGTLTELRVQADKSTELFDLHGHCLMPSFLDSHGHLVMNGQMSLFADLSGCETSDALVRVMKDYIAEQHITDEGAAIGFGYDHNFLPDACHPDRYLLDQISTVIPVMILHVSGHMGCVNSAGLAACGITDRTPNPPGGAIGRLPGSEEPSGYLEEGAMMLIQKGIMSRVPFDQDTMMLRMQQAYIENGITTIQDGATTEKDWNLLMEMARSKRLKVDVIGYPLMSAGGAAIVHTHPGLCRSYQNRLKIGGYKLVLDGSPQGRSAWMTEPYEGSDNKESGYPWLSDEEVERYIRQAVSEKQQLLAHCNGDAAADQYLNAYEKAVQTSETKENLRPVMIHCQTVRDDQLDRMAKLNMIASIFIGHVWYWGDVHVKNLGKERGNRISPAKAAMDRAIVVSFHQDTPITKPNMLHSIWCAVNRISREGAVIGEEQRICVYDALKAVTVNAAYQYFEEESKGSIAVGKRADLVILDRSPLEVQPMELCEIEVLETIKDGETIYRRDKS